MSEPRYEDVVTKVTIQAGKTAKIAETMKPLPPAKPPFGRLRTISSDKFAAVYVNGKFMGHAGEFNNPVQGLMLNPGSLDEERVEVLGVRVTCPTLACGARPAGRVTGLLGPPEDGSL